MKPSPASTAVATGVGESSVRVMPCSTSAWCSSASFVLSSSATRRARSGEQALVLVQRGQLRQFLLGLQLVQPPLLGEDGELGVPLVRGLGVLHPTQCHPAADHRTERGHHDRGDRGTRREETLDHACGRDHTVVDVDEVGADRLPVEPGQDTPPPRSEAHGSSR